MDDREDTEMMVESGAIREQEVALWRVQRSRWQPRGAVFDGDALWRDAQSIRDDGLLNAIHVFPVENGEVIEWELIAGERRTRASVGLVLGRLFPMQGQENYVRRLANVGLSGLGEQERAALRESAATIRAIVHDDVDLTGLHVLAVIENLNREGLSPIEEGQGYQSLMDAYGWSQREVATRVGRSQGYVAQRVALLHADAALQEAVSTRVLGLAHARAIAAVPQQVQGTVARWASAAVSRAEGPATTRMVEDVSRMVTAFLDPDRWLPNGERVYTPQERNRLRLLRHVVTLVADPRHNDEELGGRLLQLRTTTDGNILNKSPSRIVAYDPWMMLVLETLDPVNYGHKRIRRISQSWAVFGMLHDYDCEHCVFHGREVGDLQGLEGHCWQWTAAARGGGGHSCEGFIGADDPVIIPVTDHHTLAVLARSEYAVEMQSGAGYRWFADVDAYMTALAWAAEWEAEQVEEETTAQADARAWMVREIQKYWEYIRRMPIEWRQDFQAHGCENCRYYNYELMEEGLPPCQLVRDPLYIPYTSNSVPRAPEFGLLVGQDGRILPRCEAFALADVPDLGGGDVPWVSFEDRERVMAWLHAMLRVVNMRYAAGLRLPLRWLDCGWTADSDKTKWPELRAYILRNWDALGGAVGVARLLDMAAAETTALREFRFGRYDPVVLVSPEGEGRYVDCAWRALSGALPHNAGNWPEGWVRPWEGHDGGI